MRPVPSALAAALAVAACGGSSTNAGTDAAADGSSAAIACGATTCSGGQICVVTTSSGGVCLGPDDAGLCPDGHPAGPGQCCGNPVSTTYACQTLPAACAGALACPCASPLCQCGGCDIADAGTLKCECLYP